MAYPIPETSTYDGGTTDGTTGNYVVQFLPPHQSGDLIVSVFSHRASTVSLTITSGWSIERQGSNVLRAGIAWKVAASNSETPPTWTGRASVNCSHVAFVVRDFDSTTPVHLSSVTTRTGAGTIASSPLTTTVNDCLVIYAICTDNTDSLIPTEYANYIRTYPAGTGTGNSVSYIPQTTAGDVPSINGLFSGSTSRSSVCFTVAIKNSTSGQAALDARSTVTPVWRHLFNGGTATTWRAPNYFAWFTAVGGINVTTTAPTTTDSAWTSVEAASLPGLIVGAWQELPSTVDFTNKVVNWFGLQVGFSARWGSVGSFIVIADSSGNWAAYSTIKWSRDANALNAKLHECSFAPGNSVALETSGTIKLSDIKYIGTFYHKLGTAASVSLTTYNITTLDKATFTGMGAVPITCKDFYHVLTGYYSLLYIGSLQASAQALNKLPVQFGDGSIKTSVKLTSGSYESPPSYSPLDNYYYNVISGGSSVTIKASSADTYDLSASSMVSSRAGNSFTIDSASSTSATYNFAGWTCVGYTVTWKTGITCDRASFSACPTIDGKAATFSNCTISASTGTYAIALDAGGSVAGTAFTKGSDTNALNLRTAGTYNLQGTTFSGYTTPIKITATTGTVTLTLNSGQTQPTYSSDGATVVYDQPNQIDIDISGMVEGSVYALYNRTTSAELIAPTTIGSSGAFFDVWTYIADIPVRLVVRKATAPTKYLPYTYEGTITSNGFSVVVSQVVDPVNN